jgi:predicted patatin/cPLA2 family phospholipase
MISRRAILEKLVDIDYLMDIEKNKKKLDTDKIAKSKIGFFIKAFNIETKKDEYLDGKIDTLKKMQATSAVIPFYPHSIKIHDHHYADGSVFSEISDPLLENLIAENRDKKIFLVFNNHRTTRVSLTSILENFIRTILLMFYFRKTFILRKLNIFSENRKLKKYLQYPNVKIIEPDFDFSPFCTDKEKILQLYANGMLKAQESMIENDIISK